MATYYGKGRKAYDLGALLGSGGEGNVYRINGQRGSVAKLYKPERLAGSERQNMRDKLEAMLAANVNPYVNGHLVVAWPTDILTDSSGQFVGFVMPEVESKKSLLWAMREGDRDILFKNEYHWGKAVAVAYNLSTAMDLMHSRGIIVGDSNPKNILVNEMGFVTLIDCDSFQIRSKATGKVHRCTVGMPEMWPSELQGKDLAIPGNDYTMQTDRFALAVHIFNLLVGFHPFNCVGLNVSKASRHVGDQQINIVRGICPYVTGSTEAPPVGAPDVRLLPDDIRALFDRVFRYDVNTAVKRETRERRPTAGEWSNALLKLHKSTLTKCRKNHLHRYAAHYSKGCPWCDALKRQATPPPPKPAPTPTPRPIPTYTTPAQVKSAATQTQPLRPTPVPGNTTPQPKHSGTSGSRPRRSPWLLYLLCIALGALGAAYPAELLTDILWDGFGWSLEVEVAALILGCVGAITGGVMAHMAADHYIRSNNGWAWMLLALLAPVASWLVAALILLGVGLVVMAISAVVSIIGLIFVMAALSGS